MRPFDVVPDLKIGSVVEVSGTAARVELDGGITELTRSYAGRVYAVGQIASIVKIHFGRRVLFAYVRLLRMRSELQMEAGGAPLPPDRDQRLMEIDLFGEGTWHANRNHLDFSRGVTTYPLPLQGVYLMSHQEVQALFNAAESQRRDGEDPMVELGRYVGAEAAQARANINKMFAQHCAVLGSTGSGKSATVAALLHGVLKQRDGAWRPRIVVIDPHGEYAKAFGERAIVYRAYETMAEGEEAARPILRLPYWLMSGDEFRSLIIGKEEEATTQNNIIYKALAHARMVHLEMIEAAKDWVGSSEPAAQPGEPRRRDGVTQDHIDAFDRDLPHPFSLDEFEAHIVKEQGVVWKATPAPAKWERKSTTDFKSHRSALDKLRVLRADPRLSFLMRSYEGGDPDLAAIIEQFVGIVSEEERQDIRIIDISGLPNEVAGPLAAVIARLLFQYKVWQTREERERDPVLLVCEEAHRYVPNHGQAEYEAAQTAVRRLAREGRKYGLGLMLVSQRPADVESTVLSQCNSWLIMRLTNSSDQEHVARFLPDSLSGLTKLLPALVRREALFVGEAAAIPARIKIRELLEAELPDSNDIRFADGWAKPPIGRADIQRVVARWRREAKGY